MSPNEFLDSFPQYVLVISDCQLFRFQLFRRATVSFIQTIKHSSQKRIPFPSLTSQLTTLNFPVTAHMSLVTSPNRSHHSLLRLLFLFRLALRLGTCAAVAQTANELLVALRPSIESGQRFIGHRI